MYDTQDQVMVSPSYVMSDGNTYWLNPNAPFVFFTDSACTQPIAAANPSYGWLPGPYALNVTDSADAGAEAATAYSVGATTAAPSSFYQGSASSCTAKPPPTGFVAEATFYAVGAERAPSSFVQYGTGHD
jgi:hypothetical protein